MSEKLSRSTTTVCRSGLHPRLNLVESHSSLLCERLFQPHLIDNEEITARSSISFSRFSRSSFIM